MAELGTGFDPSAIEAGFAGAETLSAAFRTELVKVQAELKSTDRETRSLSRSMGSTLRGAFEDLVFGGAKVSDVLLDVGRSMASSVFSAAFAPVQGAIGSGVTSLVEGGMKSLLSGLLPFEKGGAFGSGRVRAFASGGVVDRPTFFPMRGGTGLMGEAGPEAIMPLSRGADGRLGIRAGGGAAPVNVTMHVTTPDAESFRRSQSQMAAGVARALKRGQRNL